MRSVQTRATNRNSRRICIIFFTMHIFYYIKALKQDSMHSLSNLRKVIVPSVKQQDFIRKPGWKPREDMLLQQIRNVWIIHFLLLLLPANLGMDIRSRLGWAATCLPLFFSIHQHHIQTQPHNHDHSSLKLKVNLRIQRNNRKAITSLEEQLLHRTK